MTGMHSQSPPCFAVRHRPPTEEGIEPSGQVLTHPPAAPLFGQPPHREDREVACRDGIRVVPVPRPG